MRALWQTNEKAAPISSSSAKCDNKMHWHTSQVTKTLRLFKRRFDSAPPPPPTWGSTWSLVLGGGGIAVASRRARRLMDNIQPCNKHKCVFCLSSKCHPPPGPGYEYRRHYSPSAVPTKVPSQPVNIIYIPSSFTPADGWTSAAEYLHCLSSEKVVW